MRNHLEWGIASYEILNGNKVVLDKKGGAACFSDFMSRFNSPYDTIRIYKLDCKPTLEYKNFYLQYVIDMLQIEGSFSEEHFEFKSLGFRIKDAAVMSIVRFIWENIGTNSIDTPNLFFKRLRDDECPHEDKLERFLYFYKDLSTLAKITYFSDGHSWSPGQTKIRSTQQFVDETNWTSVNGFFTRI